MSSPAPPSTPTRRSSRRSQSSSSNQHDEVHDSDLAQPLPTSPPQHQPTTPSRAPSVSGTAAGPPVPNITRGPGSVVVSEIDLSSPVTYGMPSSVGSSQARTPRGGLLSAGTGTGSVRGTPVRSRSDIQSDKKVRLVNLTPGPNAGSGIPSSEQDAPISTPTRRTRSSQRPPSEIIPESETSDSAPFLVIWGTDISVEIYKKKFKKFINHFVDPNAEEDEKTDQFDPDEPLYMQRLAEIEALGSPFLNLNCGHLHKYDEVLYRQLICYPQEVFPILDMAVNEVFFEKYPDSILTHQIQVRPFNADKTRNIRALNPEDIDQLITISGMVIRTSNVIPEMREAFFQCTVCHLTATVEVERGRVTEPTLCTNCNTNHSFALIHNRSTFSDKQMIKLQESPDDMPAGQTPYTVVLYAHDTLVDVVQPGDRISVTGVYRAIPTRVNPNQRNIKSVFKTHMDVVHFRRTDTRRLHDGDSESKDHIFDPARVELIKKLSEKPDIYERLANAIAPSIFENDDVKKGILLQLFGGSKKDFKSAGRSNFRAEINILLCGDPGTSKSQLLQYVFNLVPRSQYTSGKGSSAVGLTAYVMKDPESNQLVLQTGALVLADNGICCIDEFDKMNESTRSILHEVMEQQTLSIAKAGIICQLNARTSILAAANPIESQWNNKKTIVENIMLPHTLMSRFDLIFLILDPQDETYDKRLARHLVSLYYRSREEVDQEILGMSLLRDYIAYAKQNFHPTLSEEAGNHLIQAYVKMREVGNRRGRITAYPRQLESLIRLAEAHAKMRLSSTVEVQDVEEANRLHQEALKQSATDPNSGIINLDILTTGHSESYRVRREEVKNALRNVIKHKMGKSVTNLSYQKTWNELRESSDQMITREMYEDALKDLADEELITMTSRSNFRINKK